MPIPLVWSNQLDLTPFIVQPDIAPPRGILGGDGATQFHAEVVVDEDGDDDLVITEHPISGGAVIHDHAFKRPSEVRVRMGWSTMWLTSFAMSVRQLYEQILAFQASRIPCTVYTGKRQYDNMLVASLRTHTDASLEHSIIVDVAFREVVLTSTSAWAIGSITYNQGALANPESNTQTINGGQVQLVPATVAQNSVPPQIDQPANPPASPDQPANPQQLYRLPSRVYGPR